MRRTFDAVCLSAFIGAWPAPSVCAEFTDSDVLPAIGYVVFTRDAVGFVSRPNRKFGDLDLVFRFAYDRGSRKLAEVDTRQFEARFPGNAHKYDPREASMGSEQHELIGHAGKGAEYRSKLKYCGEGGEDDENKQPALTIGNKAVRILAANKCTGVSSLEIVGDQVWLGTVYSGEGGYSTAEGIIVESPGGGRVLARIPLTGWVTQVREDPFSGEVWAATEYGIYEIGRQFRILSAHFYYDDFDPLTGEPRFSFSGTAIPGNPLSVVSRCCRPRSGGPSTRSQRRFPRPISIASLSTISSCAATSIGRILPASGPCCRSSSTRACRKRRVFAMYGGRLRAESAVPTPRSTASAASRRPRSTPA